VRNLVDIQRLYFRRSIWTTENQRFGLILAGAFLLLIPLNLFLMHWSYRISHEYIAQHIKTNYIAFLAHSKKTTLPVSVQRTILSDISKIKRRKSAASKPVGPSTAVSSISGLNEAPDLATELYHTDSLGLTAITSAVEETAGYPGMERHQPRQEKFMDLQNRKRIFRTRDNRISIPIPEVLHFASRNGMRDLQETTAILEINEADIKYCFEKVAKYDPSFSASVLISFTIHPDGYVIPATVKIIKSNIRDPQILDCIRKQIQRWRNFTQIAFEEGNFTVTRKYIF
jgi:hypothetical protein